MTSTNGNRTHVLKKMPYEVSVCARRYPLFKHRLADYIGNTIHHCEVSMVYDTGQSEYLLGGQQSLTARDFPVEYFSFFCRIFMYIFFS